MLKVVGAVRKVVGTVLEVVCFPESTLVFGAERSSVDLLFFQGHDMASGEQLRYSFSSAKRMQAASCVSFFSDSKLGQAAWQRSSA